MIVQDPPPGARLTWRRKASDVAWTFLLFTGAALAALAFGVLYHLAGTL